jgi:site-specific recombinase XerD
MKENDLLNTLKSLSSDDLSLIQNVIEKLKDEKKQILNGSSTIMSFCDEYYSYVEQEFSETYLRSVKLAFKTFSKFIGENKNLDEITIKEIEKFKLSLLKTSPKGFVVYFRNLKAAFNKAVLWGYINYNPFTKIKIIKAQVNKPIYLTMEDFNKIVECTENPNLQELFIFTFNTGCRVSEIVNLKWSDIDFDKEIITIGSSDFTTKSKKQRIIPMNRDSNQILTNTWKAKRGDFVFHKSMGYHYHTDYISKKFKDSVRKAKLSEQIHFHTLRHSFASNLANRGVPLIVIQELMGHSSIVTTQIYSHTNLNNLREGINKLTAA